MVELSDYYESKINEVKDQFWEIVEAGKVEYKTVDALVERVKAIAYEAGVKKRV